MTAEHEIVALLKGYATALNAGDAAAASRFFTPDAVVAGAGFPTLGGAALEEAYAGMFGAVRMAVTFEILEVEVAGPSTAWARTTSHGTQTLLATGEEKPEANRELFILKRGDEGWRVARYVFNEAPGPAA